MPLNDLQCKNAKPRINTYFLADGEGLFLQVMPSGGKYWRFKFRLHNRHRILALGVYPAISLAQAREGRDIAKRELAIGKDPILQQIERKQLAKYAASQTFEAIAREWHEFVKGQWSEKYATTVLYRLETYLFRDLGRFPIAALTPAIVLACLEKVEKTSRDMAHRLLRCINQVFLRAVSTSRLANDFTPALKQALKPAKSGNFACIDLKQLRDLLIAIREDEKRSKRQVNIAMQLMLLTFVRTTELINAKWQEFDLPNALWIVPAERMKMRREHLVPLSRQALALLTELKAISGEQEHLFPSIPNPRKPICNNTLLVALGRMKFKGIMTGHGFRSLAMTIALEELEYDFDVIDRQLAHVPRGVRKSYDRAKYLRQRRTLMQDYADYLDRVLLTPEQKGTPDLRPTHQPAYQFTSLAYSLSPNSGGYGYAGNKPLNTIRGRENGALPGSEENQRPTEWLEAGRNSSLH